MDHNTRTSFLRNEGDLFTGWSLVFGVQCQNLRRDVGIWPQIVDVSAAGVSLRARTDTPARPGLTEYDAVLPHRALAHVSLPVLDLS